MEVMEEAVQKKRRVFRTAHQMGDEQTVVYVGAGNTKEEILFSLQLAIDSVTELRSRPVLNNQPLSNFRVVVSVEKDLKWVVDDLLSS